MYCYRALADHYAQKAESALHVLRYKYSNDIKDLENALPLLEQSIASYKELVRLTKGAYLYANSMQTKQRKIPMRGVDATFKTWAEVLVPFKHAIDSLKHKPADSVNKVKSLVNADVNFGNTSFAKYIIDSSSSTFTDTSANIIAFAKELKGLEGLKLSHKQQLREGTNITFTSTKPVKVLVGFFHPEQAAFTKNTVFLKAPELETNASANDYGQAETKIANAIVVKGMPPVNIHSYNFNAGTNTLKLAKGIVLILGFTDGDQTIPLYDAGLTENGARKEIDWLFE
jgi:hypothetical protein